MRTIIFILIAILSIQTVVAASVPPHTVGAQGTPPVKKALYSKGKGVIGLITGLTLGPVGYAAVCIFSHNRVQRKKALLGMEIWTGLALSALLILLILKNAGFQGSGKGSGGKGSGKTPPNINFPDLNIPGPGSPKRKPPRPIPAL